MEARRFLCSLSCRLKKARAGGGAAACQKDFGVEQQGIWSNGAQVHDRAQTGKS